MTSRAYVGTRLATGRKASSDRPRVNPARPGDRLRRFVVVVAMCAVVPPLPGREESISPIGWPVAAHRPVGWTQSIEPTSTEWYGSASGALTSNVRSV